MPSSDTEQFPTFRKEPRIWCKAFTSSIIYNPTDPSEILEMYEDMVKFAYTDDLTDSLSKAAMLHYQFEMIKPFDQYNGFLGRLIFPMILSQAEFYGITFLPFSEFLYKDKERYFSILSSTQATGDHLSWIKYIIRGLISSSENSVEMIHQVEAIIEKDIHKIRNSKTRVKGIEDVYNYYKKHLVSEILPVTKELNLSYNTVAKSVDLLIKLKILNMENDQSRHRRFVYNNILKTLKFW